jgi:peptidoglycan/xylan/chitin deacetylase (PgdA/CDA1 family)
LIPELLGAGATAAAALHAGPGLAPVVPGLGRALGVELRQEGNEGVAITFDDGPHPQGTPAILEVLRERKATATFFLAGEQVDRRPTLVREIVAAGHRVELHCYKHRNLLRLGVGQFLEDAERARVAIEDASGQAVAYYRPPFGVFSAATLRAARRRWRPLLWSRWGRDWDRWATAESISRRASAGIVAGDIVLLHDADYYNPRRGSWVRTAAALPLILDGIEAEGLKTSSLRR